MACHVKAKSHPVTHVSGTLSQKSLDLGPVGPMLNFIQNSRRPKRGAISEGQQPFAFMMPHSSWTPPRDFPNLSDAKEIAIDTETYDPYLKQRGPGYLRAKSGSLEEGFVCGVGIAVDRWRGYFPLRHPESANCDPEVLARFLNDTFQSADRNYVFAHAAYDLGWLRTLGVEVAGEIIDIQIADPLLDEENPQGYSLEALCRRWLGEGKDETLLKAAANALGYDNPKAVMHKIPAKYVGPYGEADPDQTLRIWQKIKEHHEWPDLSRIWAIEKKVTRVLFEMMWQGVQVDLDYGQKLNDRWKKEEEECYRQLGFREIWEDTAVRQHFARQGINHQGSLDKGFLECVEHPHGKLLRQARELNRCRTTFLEQNLLQNSTSGRIHPQYVQLASDEGGTRTGRLSCKNPNAQQFPKRSGLIDSKSIRKCLIPEDGMLWAKWDFWSQEPTIQCHYGLVENLGGAEQVARQFAEGVKLYTFIEQATKGKLTYDQAKAVALGRSYGMGKAKMASTIGLPEDECEIVLRAFDAVVPYIGILAERFQSRASSRGWIKTLLGSRRRFNLWQPSREWGNTPLTRPEALKNWPDQALERAFVYKAFNAGIQGSAANQAKKALVDIYETIGLPSMAVHDEISKSVKDEKEAKLMGEIMCNAVKLRLPVRADLDLGVTWC